MTRRDRREKGLGEGKTPAPKETAKPEVAKAKQEAAAAKPQEPKQAKGFNLDDIADMPIVMTVFPGSRNEGDKVEYVTRAADRTILAQGTVRQIVDYSVGKKVTLDKQDFEREVGRKQQPYADRIQTEMKGERGYTVTINGRKVGLDEKVNPYFKQVEKQGIKFMGGVEMVVSAVIVPGNDLRAGYDRKTDDLSTYLKQ